MVGRVNRGDLVMLSIRAPSEVKARLVEAAWQQRTTVTELLLRPWMEPEKKPAAAVKAGKTPPTVPEAVVSAADPMAAMDALEEAKPAPYVYPKATAV
jgi:hypothetical protein